MGFWKKLFGLDDAGGNTPQQQPVARQDAPTRPQVQVPQAPTISEPQRDAPPNQPPSAQQWPEVTALTPEPSDAAEDAGNITPESAPVEYEDLPEDSDAVPLPVGIPEPTDADLSLFEITLAALEQAGFVPRRPLTFTDLLQNNTNTVLHRFRSRPLTTLLTVRDLDENLLYPNVYVDRTLTTRVSVDELHAVVEDMAQATGISDEVDNIILMLDKDSASSGSFRFTYHTHVRDVSFDLDPDVGDQQAEYDIATAMAPKGTQAHWLFDGVTAQAVVVWAPAGDRTIVDALLAENLPD